MRGRNVNARLNLTLLATAAALTLVATLWLQDSPPPRPAVNVGPHPAIETNFPGAQAPAPNATLHLLDGRMVDLAAYRGKAVLLNFWASWCIPCAVEYPQMLRLAATLPDDLVILAVSSDAERAAIDRFLARHGTGPDNVIIAHDPEKKITQDLFGTVRLPETILIDAAGIMREKVIGASVEWDAPEMESKIRALAAPP